MDQDTPLDQYTPLTPVTLTLEQLRYVRVLDAEIQRAHERAETLYMAKQLYCAQILKAQGITDGQFAVDAEAGLITPKGA
jgi:hypothetical protein